MRLHQYDMVLVSVNVILSWLSMGLDGEISGIYPHLMPVWEEHING
jgi:hypothetical protein